MNKRTIIRHLTHIVSLCLITHLSWGQFSFEDRITIDSLKYVIASSQDDSIKVSAYVVWDNMIYWSDPELDFDLNKRVVNLCAKNLNAPQTKSRTLYYKKELAFAYNNIGTYFESTGNHLESIDYFNKTLSISANIQNKSGIANAYNNLGNAYKYLGDTGKAINFYELSIDVREEIGDEIGKGTSLNNIGIIYKENYEFEKAERYFFPALAIFEKEENVEGKGMVIYNLGLMELFKDNPDSAMVWFQKSLELNRAIDFKSRVSAILSQMSDICLRWGERAQEKEDESSAKKHFLESEKYAKESLELALETESISDINFAYRTLYRAQEKLEKFEEALANLIAFNAYAEKKDSLMNQKEFLRREHELEYRALEAQDSIKLAEEKKIAQIRSEKERTQRYALYGGILLLVFFGGYILDRFRKSQKQKQIIERQKALVEEQHEEIMDSINYAKRIQAAILPPLTIFKDHLKDSFVLYLPKDIVAGDFYWLQPLDEQVLFAVADCTGHGVPGAMVSVVCNNALNRSVKEFDLIEPGQILDRTRQIVVKEFEKAEEDVKDGMDIALVSLATRSRMIKQDDEKGNTHSGTASHAALKYAGAHNPLWIVRNTEIIEIKADKQPVGRFEHQRQFETKEIELQKGDTFYIFSDGMVDQFGGPKGKKFKAKSLRELFLRIQDESLDQQQKSIQTAFEDWKGNYEQVDDICIVGVRV